VSAMNALAWGASKSLTAKAISKMLRVDVIGSLYRTIIVNIFPIVPKIVIMTKTTPHSMYPCVPSTILSNSSVFSLARANWPDLFKLNLKK